MQVNQAKLDEFMGRALNDAGAAMHASLVVLGDRLGLYKAMAGAGPLTSAELAAKTHTNERNVREWLNANAASGYVDYDAASGRYTLPDEQAMALAQEDSPAFLPGLFDIIKSMMKDEDQLEKAFKQDGAFGWHEHSHDLFRGTERFFRPGYNANLTNAWIPALEGVEEKLKRGARVADVGCGHGASTILMAKTYPRSRFFGFDYHAQSIEAAHRAAVSAGVDERIEFHQATAKTFSGPAYDFITFFDCLHDMGDPVGAAAHVLDMLKPDGTWMIVEPYASDNVTENLNPVGRVFYSASTMICTPASLAQEVGLALGAQAGEKQIREVVTKAGFTRFRRAMQTPFNLIFEARP